ncbi:hypothetical protein QYR09_02085 [Cellulophaga lytica]|nr:hypothetical protein QYR09_02085 [Cellulophaga lytica]
MIDKTSPRTNLLCFFVLCFSSLISGQTSILGTITSTDKEPLLGATISISKSPDEKILAYSTSNIKGKFNIKVSSALDSLFVSISHLGYVEWTKYVKNKNVALTVILEESDISLDEVILKFEPIQKEGDTINYAVSSFKDQNDRVIADIIKKLPGIEIRPGGQIFYQGKPIEKYYIDGMDMLEGRYNLANNSLSANSVSKIQVLENHQPIKVLDSLTVTDRASLNIKLKKNITVSGSGRLAVGFPDLLWEAGATPLFFLKKQQFLASYQTNNTGNDLLSEITNFYSIDKDNSLGLVQRNWLTNINPSSPPFAKERWLQNNANLGAVNSLFRIKNDIDLKISFSYFNDFQVKEGTSFTSYYTQNDTINIRESIKSNVNKQNLNSTLILEKNTKKTYLKNAINFKGSWDSFKGNILRDSIVKERLERPYIEFKNNFRSYFTLGKQLLSLQSTIIYNQTSPELFVTPGQFSPQNTSSSAQNIQNLENSGLSIQNSVGFTKSINGINISSDLGFGFSDEKLQSKMSSANINFDESYNNDFNYKRGRLYLNTRISFEKNKWKTRINLPIGYFTLKTNNRIADQQNTGNYFLFEPNLFVSKKMSPYWTATGQYSLNKTFGQISQLHTGFLLTNYRTLSRYNAPIAESTNHNSVLKINFRHPLSAFFTSLSYGIKKSTKNLLYSIAIAEDGQLVNNAFVYDNTTTSNNLELSASKRFSKIRTLINATARYSFSNAIQILNDDLYEIKSKRINIRIGVDSQVADWLSVSFKSNLNRFSSKFLNIEPNWVLTQKYDFQAAFFLTETQELSLSNELYINSEQSNTMNAKSNFLNLKYQFSLPKNKMDFYIKWHNISNEKSYVNYFNSDYLVSQSRYFVRPSQVLFGTKISF